MLAFTDGISARACVAGVYAPAFVERLTAGQCNALHGAPVSPEFMLRPSLSVRGVRYGARNLRVSSEFMLRPSLSDGPHGAARSHPPRVAGVYAPAFVERGHVSTRPTYRCVSPAFMLRPSLSASIIATRRTRKLSGVAGVYAPAFVERLSVTPSGSLTSTGVAGVYAPAFVERTSGVARSSRR